MNNQRWLISLVVILAVINIALLGIVWRGHVIMQRQAPRFHNRMDRPEITGRSIMRDLELNDEQREEFREIFGQHRNHMDSLNFIMRQIKHEVNKAIILDDSAALKSNNSKLLELQKEAELETQDLTRKLSHIASKEQKEKFLQSMEGALMRDRSMEAKRQQNERPDN